MVNLKTKYLCFYRFLCFQTYTAARNMPAASQGSSGSYSSSNNYLEQLSKTNLYIRGLAPETSDKDLVNLCSQ